MTKHCEKCKSIIPKSKDPRNRFCSSKCANQTIHKSTRLCACGNKLGLTKSGNTRYKCQTCLDSSRISSQTIESTLGEGPNRFNKIRHDARRVLDKSKRKKICNECGYSKHVEVCHLKSISSFNIQELVSKVNDLTNLVYLCPNHHWELDNQVQSSRDR